MVAGFDNEVRVSKLPSVASSEQISLSYSQFMSELTTMSTLTASGVRENIGIMLRDC